MHWVCRHLWATLAIFKDARLGRESRRGCRLLWDETLWAIPSVTLACALSLTCSSTWRSLETIRAIYTFWDDRCCCWSLCKSEGRLRWGGGIDARSVLHVDINAAHLLIDRSSYSRWNCWGCQDTCVICSTHWREVLNLFSELPLTLRRRQEALRPHSDTS
jgi:hypothetical protein